ncbi:hypothetical protein [Rhizobium sp. PL01]|uniref:hypothetical protein n=1 Tax=Rhizobium sp. PL01 TaxID=3085631 RepID=UPI002980DC2C|nr:hypothetical protein [Rhizobium sp. PL01]MDW5313743.1 hypothetical protein [Rhizobium sp. PL01]
MSEDENTTPAARRQSVEERFIAQCRDWSLSIGSWTVKAAELRKEREKLDDEMVSIASGATVMLMKTGMRLPDAETHVEALMEKAFAR